jgi:hypothetical protein
MSLLLIALSLFGIMIFTLLGETDITGCLFTLILGIAWLGGDIYDCVRSLKSRQADKVRPHKANK